MGECTKREAPAYRSAFQRDRDRIIHSAAFRRLEHKTQVFVNHEGDMFRTRLTHSIEAAQTSRTIARAMGSRLRGGDDGPLRDRGAPAALRGGCADVTRTARPGSAQRRILQSPFVSRHP